MKATNKRKQTKKKPKRATESEKKDKLCEIYKLSGIRCQGLGMSVKASLLI
jgi:hypothetical protein